MLITIMHMCIPYTTKHLSLIRKENFLGKEMCTDAMHVPFIIDKMHLIVHIVSVRPIGILC